MRKTVHSSLVSGDMVKIDEDNIAKRKGAVSRDQVAALEAGIITMLRSDVERSPDVSVAQEDWGSHGFQTCVEHLLGEYFHLLANPGVRKTEWNSWPDLQQV
jgi:hypothetical protein